MKTNFDDWYDQFYSSSEKEQYNMIIKILNGEVIKKTEGVDIVLDCLLKVLGFLDYKNLIEEHLALIELIKQKQPALNKNRFMYFDGYLFDYYCFQKQDDLAKESLKMFEECPVDTCDRLISLLTKLQLLQKRDIVLELVAKVFSKIAKSKSLLDGTDYYFGRVVYRDSLQDVYEDSLKEKNVDWIGFTKKLKKYLFFTCSHTKDEITFLQHCLSHDLPNTAEDNVMLFKKNPIKYRDHVGYDFMKHMHSTQKMSFICSGTIWDEFVEFMNEYKPKKEDNPKYVDSLFAFSKEELNQYLGKLLRGLLSQKQTEGFALLWGIPYLYDFLLSKEIISKRLYGKVIDIVKKLKPDIQKVASTDLWVYTFWTSWTPPSYLTENEFEKEKDIFENSINKTSPLSEEIPEIDEFEDEWEEDEPLVQIEEISRDDIPEIINPNPFVGTVVNTEKTGRNEPCPCGSGKKFKKCCG